MMDWQKYDTVDAKLVVVQVPAHTASQSRSIVTQISILTSRLLTEPISDEQRSQVFELAKKRIADEHMEASALMRTEEGKFRCLEELPEHGLFLEIRSRSWEYQLGGRVAYVDGEKAETANIKWQVLVEPIRE